MTPIRVERRTAKLSVTRSDPPRVLIERGGPVKITIIRSGLAAPAGELPAIISGGFF